MTDGEKLQAIYDALLWMKRRMEEVLEGHARPEVLRADDLVDVYYVMRATGLAKLTILQGKAGIRDIPLASKRPRRWLKRDVDAWQRARAAGLRPAREKAFRILDRRGRRGKRSAA